MQPNKILLKWHFKIKNLENTFLNITIKIILTYSQKIFSEIFRKERDQEKLLSYGAINSPSTVIETSR